MLHFTSSELTMSKYITIEKAPFQRNEDLHSGPQCLNIIASILNGFDIGTALIGIVNNKPMIIDGIQRKSDVLRFINNEFVFKIPSNISQEVETLYKSSKIISLIGKYFKDMPNNIRKEILTYKISVRSSRMTLDEARVQFIISNGGLPLNRVEKENTSAEGTIYDVINTINDSVFFKEHQVVTDKARKRMSLKKLIRDCMAHLILKEFVDAKETKPLLDQHSADSKAEGSLYMSRFNRILSHIEEIIPLNKKNTFNSSAGFFALFASIRIILEEYNFKPTNIKEIRNTLEAININKHGQFDNFKRLLKEGTNHASNRENATLVLKEKIISLYK